MRSLHVADIKPHSVTEGPDLRTSVFLQGCSIRCEGCVNPHLWPAEGGQEMTIEQILQVIERARAEGDNGVSLLGGEPLDQPGGVASLCQVLRARGVHTIVYTGYTYEHLLNQARQRPEYRTILATAGVLVDGPFLREKRDLSLAYRGSRNQRVIDLAATREHGELTLLDWDSNITITILPEGSIIVPLSRATHSLLETLGTPQQIHTCGQQGI